MSFIGTILKGGLTSGLLLGVGALLVGSAVVSVAGTVLRPFAKATIKGGVNAYDRSKDLLSEVRRKPAQGVKIQSRSEISEEKEQPGTPPVTVKASAAEKPDSGRSRPWIVRGW